jgi:hypothetical protein
MKHFKIVAWLILHLSGIEVFAQPINKVNHLLSFSLRGVENSITKHPQSQSLDFLNYYDTRPDYFDEITINLGYKFNIRHNWLTDINLIIASDLAPANFDISTHYFINQWFGIGIGSMLNKSYISNFEQFQLTYLPEYYLTDGNSQQIKLYELGLYVSPALKINLGKWLTSNLKCNIGTSTNPKHTIDFIHKQKDGNERVLHQYKTLKTFNPFINPTINLELKALQMAQTDIGFLLRSDIIYSRPQINYMHTIKTWIGDNGTTSEIKPPSHNFMRFTTALGIYVRW